MWLEVQVGMHHVSRYGDGVDRAAIRGISGR